jgi:hypothetical protein
MAKISLKHLDSLSPPETEKKLWKKFISDFRMSYASPFLRLSKCILWAAFPLPCNSLITEAILPPCRKLDLLSGGRTNCLVPTLILNRNYTFQQIRLSVKESIPLMFLPHLTLELRKVLEL